MVVQADLRRAFRERPAALYGHPDVRPGFSSPDPVVRRAMESLNRPRLVYEKGRYQAKLNNEAVLCRDMWTAQEFRTFRHLVERCMDPSPQKRQEGEVWMRRFREKHGNDVCRMMLAEIRRIDEIAWFKRQNVTRGA